MESPFAVPLLALVFGFLQGLLVGKYMGHYSALQLEFQVERTKFELDWALQQSQLWQTQLESAREEIQELYDRLDFERSQSQQGQTCSTEVKGPGPPLPSPPPATASHPPRNAAVDPVPRLLDDMQRALKSVTESKSETDKLTLAREVVKLYKSIPAKIAVNWGGSNGAETAGWLPVQEMFAAAPLNEPWLNLSMEWIFDDISKPECVQDLDTKTEFEFRCPQLRLMSYFFVIKRRGDEVAVQTAWTHMSKFRDPRGHDQPLLQWRYPQQTTAIYLTELRAKPLWQRNETPYLAQVADAMEANAAQLRQEFDIFSVKVGLDGLAEFDAYPNLVAQGLWKKVSLFDNETWDAKLCEHLPTACSAFGGLLGRRRPGTRGIHLPPLTTNTEEASFFVTDPGSHVVLHNGGSNGRLNLHICLAGCSGTELRVHTPQGVHRHEWEEGRMSIIFDDAFDHEVRHPSSAAARRVLLAVGVYHPDLLMWPGIYARANHRTHYQQWSSESHQLLLADRAAHPPPQIDPKQPWQWISDPGDPSAQREVLRDA
eukprot:gb/GFBE01030896.1/.p1 GENE.gb/GFBE01030896.1/~~gb/GFBE01030896.1/.p1  ORF type:complete len:542 (+),score=91.42 gb/GFBE01030896.1/:1-1626(+)